MTTKTLDQAAVNKTAESQLLKTYPYHNLKTAFRESGRYGELINYLRLLGLKCVTSGCGGLITTGILKHADYDVTKVKCRKCWLADK